MVDFENWISELDGNINLAQLSIPGTHNSAACHTSLPSVRCQDESITEQLKHGVRFFDIRLGKLFLEVKDDDQYELQVIHGKFPVRIPAPVKFSLVLNEFYDFLDKHPNETVIVSLKQEGEDSWGKDTDEFPRFVWDNYLKKDKDKWFLSNQIPKLDECKSKLILFRRFGVKQGFQYFDNRSDFGIDAEWWTYNTKDDDRGFFEVQDYCELNEPKDIDEKAMYVKDLIGKALQCNTTNTDNSKLFINFCSGANFFNIECWPKKIAKRMAEHNIQDMVGAGSGTVIIDYAGLNDWEIVKKIVGSNF
ncbi:uncharacterized protein SCODWIG_02792 [Saccharomycodes ludwigii]|uniref:Phosphatidylinositol-specific phospholipase C X domain-containing protein n=1 Tax=Saccharomycodes ludwigii TaxID=36035 RepID=A0A376B8U4_9ASCO|nr:conserved putative 1-phosphatidylinositol phosphodiesterase [Saccharomycodes ludwigii]KAH3900541.1 conserved putative 1-phosphatidylinositol phosphodiesterase [Saccharomycodes ludwigii]SSD61031.1 uncharacterized protein SCODWIG_02792 [Saccharomycodes ludwigii]